MAFFKSALIFLIVALTSRQSNATDENGIYKIGVGIADITGPPAGVVLNGYVNPITNAAGIYTRQFARAFVVESLTTGAAVTYVTCDMGMMDHSLKQEVVKRLQAKYGEEKFTEKNVMISATHTHSGVSGFMTYFAYLVIESYGFNPISFWSAVDGITEAIEKATDSSKEGKLYWNRGEILGGNGNRANDAYMRNPEDERGRYEHNVDKDMVILKFVDNSNEEPMGVFTWWPVHPISFNGAINPLVSSDNKGYAALLFDYEMNPGQRPGKGGFVSGFGSANLGDVSPRNEGPISSSNPISPKWDFNPDIESTRLNGQRQFQKAWELFNDQANLQQITGPILFNHQFVDTNTVSVDIKDEETGQFVETKLCKGALGYGYVGLDPDQSEFWERIRELINLTAPSQEMVECQAPKLVALAAGEMEEPWEWAPTTFALQLFSIGNFDLAGLPGEFTTMAGRRVRNAIFNVTGHEVVLSGLSNNYINYVTTEEEYDEQRSEGGATVYGRNTNPVIVQLFRQMAQALEDGTQVSPGTPPPSFLDKVRDEIAPWADPLPAQNRPFGFPVVDAFFEYTPGSEVIVRFTGGSPRNSGMRGGTFLLVEKLQESTGRWEIVRTDADVDTTFYWDAGLRLAEIVWRIPANVELGTYRIRHFGNYRLHEDGPMMGYSGSSTQFLVKQ